MGRKKECSTASSPANAAMVTWCTARDQTQLIATSAGCGYARLAFGRRRKLKENQAVLTTTAVPSAWGMETAPTRTGYF